VRRRKVLAVVVLVLGVVLLAGAMADHSFAAPRNAQCQSGIGQIGQIVDSTVARDCGLVGGLETAVGWLIAAGVAALAGGAVLTRTAFWS
jgi:hypothetical protein